MRPDFTGLTPFEVAHSRSIYGDNTLTQPAKASLWSKFAERFTDPIIIILLVALTLSVGVAAYQYGTGLEGAQVLLEPIGILVAILLATLISTLFEIQAERRFEILNKVNDEELVKVIRENFIVKIPRCDIVVGDIIILETGDEVPADAELLEATSLQINESTLTGEPSAHKSADPQDHDHEATYPTDHVMRSTSVIEGHAVARVIRVGDHTEYGKVYQGAQIDNSIETPLNQQLKRLAKVITKISYSIAAAIIVARIWLYFSDLAGAPISWLDFGSYALNTIMIAVTVVVVSLPEGLPMSVTLSLALSMQRMLKANNLVRKMHACETMGATTVICTDKTGTLTQNRMTLHQAQFYQNQIDRLIDMSIATNSTAHIQRDTPTPKVVGNPTEGALLLWLEQRGVDYQQLRNNHPILEQLPFSTERKYMATVVAAGTKKVLFVKGAPEVIASLCTQIRVAGTSEPIDVFRKSIEDDLRGYQQQAMRTLAFAYAEVAGDEELLKGGKIADLDLTFLGITAIADPIRPEVAQAIKECQDGGISIKVVTGDTCATAKQIAKQIGLWRDNNEERNHMTGSEFEAMSDNDLLQKVASLKIISRARPMDKQRLVRLLQQRGEVVAVTGDGTNDAPALKAAQIGLSMGDGTAAAKEASDITILDNSFSTISLAVMWGRSLYQNIQRFILFQLTINVAACMVVLLSAILGTEPPLTVTQMLWVNLIMDTFAALALASLPPSKSVMWQAPRSNDEHIITKKMAWQIGSVGLLFTALIFSLMQYFKVADVTSLAQFSITEFAHSIVNFSHTHAGFTPYEMSLLFTIFVMLQFWNMFNARAFMSGKSALSNLKGCQSFVATSAIIIAGQWLITTYGGEMFNTTPLVPKDWALIILLTSPILIIGEIARALKRG